MGEKRYWFHEHRCWSASIERDMEYVLRHGHAVCFLINLLAYTKQCCTETEGSRFELLKWVSAETVVIDQAAAADDVNPDSTFGGKGIKVVDHISKLRRKIDEALAVA